MTETLTIRDAYRMGRVAFHQGYPRKHCPWKDDVYERMFYQAWQCGYDDAGGKR